MKDLFLFNIIIKEFAYCTEMLSKFYFTFLTVLLNWLYLFAFQTSYFLYCISINLVNFLRISFSHVLNIIMTKSASKKFQTLRAFFFTSSSIMLTSKFHSRSFNLILFFHFFIFWRLILIFSIFIYFIFIFVIIIFFILVLVFCIFPFLLLILILRMILNLLLLLILNWLLVLLNRLLLLLNLLFLTQATFVLLILILILLTWFRHILSIILFLSLYITIVKEWTVNCTHFRFI
jgi:hypothetical protein